MPMKWNLIASLFSLLIGFLVILFPYPYDKSAIIALVLCFLTIIIIGHKAAFRGSEFGISGQWVEPGKLFSTSLSTMELRLFFMSFSGLVGLGGGLLIKVYLIG